MWFGVARPSRNTGQFGSVFRGQLDHPTIIMDKATLEAELHAKWVASQDIARFQSLLNAETDDGKYILLAQLLSHELEQLKKLPCL
jgi:hypothetical protein